MAKVKYDGSTQFKPISPWGYIGYTILFAIPIVGIICLIVFALSSSNINRRNLARSYWCVFLVVVLVCVASGLLAYFNVGSVREDLVRSFPQLRNVFQNIDTASSRTTSKSILSKAMSYRVGLFDFYGVVLYTSGVVKRVR